MIDYKSIFKTPLEVKPLIQMTTTILIDKVELVFKTLDQLEKEALEPVESLR